MTVPRPASSARRWGPEIQAWSHFLWENRQSTPDQVQAQARGRLLPENALRTLYLRKDLRKAIVSKRQIPFDFDRHLRPAPGQVRQGLFHLRRSGFPRHFRATYGMLAADLGIEAHGRPPMGPTRLNAEVRRRFPTERGRLRIDGGGEPGGFFSGADEGAAGDSGNQTIARPPTIGCGKSRTDRDCTPAQGRNMAHKPR